ncbi:serine/threonine-protein kinase brsk2-like protein [Anaeramoeba flamelloides]|uniref:Serine/threonine-protein kinase brsk2-like protein n=1 Tax=Anaeramoeba flamelloides TaxID=1746091 RepID=A0AAV7ZAA0_9EUKA|nr:serine/threonine-protein kinase brsk2-like protein [Anaeramoeba flamelloides]
MTSLYVGPYKIGKTLGVGSSSKVKLAIHKDTKKKYAVKILTKSSLSEKKQMRKKVEREISILKLLKHPNIMRLYDVYETSKYLYLILEYVSGGELFDYLISKGSLSHSKALSFFQQIIFGLSYLHERLICHRDLKPENLLIDENHYIKIADFGMAQVMKKGSLLQTSCGSPHYAAPEVIAGKEYDGKMADVWCTGIILFALLSGRLPFDSNNIKRLLLKIKTGQYRMSSKFTKLERDLIRRMLVVDPKKRITINQIKKHHWFTSNYPDGYLPPDSSIKITNVDPLDKSLLSQKILKNLKTLGWGSQEEITKALCSEELNQEKIFYLVYFKSMRLKCPKPIYLKKKINKKKNEKKAVLLTNNSKKNHKSQIKKKKKDLIDPNENIVFLSTNFDYKKDNTNKHLKNLDNLKEFEVDEDEDEDKKKTLEKTNQKKSTPMSISPDQEENNIYGFEIGTPRFHRTKEEEKIGSLPITHSPKKSWFGSLFHKNQVSQEPSLEIIHEESNINEGVNLKELEEKKEKREAIPRIFFVEFENTLYEAITIFQKELTNLNFQWFFPSTSYIKAKKQKNKMKIAFNYLKKEKITEVRINHKSGKTQSYNKIARNLIKQTRKK